MKNYLLTAILPLAVIGLPLSAQASSLGQVEMFTVKLDPRKLDTSLPATERFAMLERLAERKCDTNGRTVSDIRLERACEIELKRSVLEQVGDQAILDVARNEGVF